MGWIQIWIRGRLRIRWHLIALVLIAGLRPAAGRAATFREQSERDWPAAGIERLEVANPRGLVSVRAGRDDRIHLVALKVVRNAVGHSADELSRDTRVVAERSGDRLLVRVVYPQRRNIRIGLWDFFRGFDIPDIEVRLAIEAPRSILASLRTASGDVETQGLVRGVTIVTASGDVNVHGGGAVDVQTSSGDVIANAVGALGARTESGNVTLGRAGGPVRVETSSGDVRVDVADDSVDVTTVSGDVRVGRAAGATVHTESGDVVTTTAAHARVETSSGEAQVSLMAPCELADVHTSSGDVRLEVSRALGGSLDAASGSGSLDVDLPLDTRTLTAQRVLGTFGHGSARLRVRSSSGNIHVASSGGTP